MKDEKKIGTELLPELVEDFMTQKQTQLLKVKKGQMSKQEFLEVAREHIAYYYEVSPAVTRDLLDLFEQYVFGYSILSPLIDDEEVTDIRVVSYDTIRIKKLGKRMESDIAFTSSKEYQQFVQYVATKNQVNISNLNAIQRFTDGDSHPRFILRFTISMPLVNSGQEPYLCIRKVPKTFPNIAQLIEKGMLDKETAQLLIMRFREGSTLICGGNSSGKTTILNALKETLPNNMAVLVIQQADELTTVGHPDMMFLHSLPKTGESMASYELKDISIAGLTMDVDCFIIGEIKGEEAMYFLNAAYTGQICAATIHAPSAAKAANKLVDYCMYESRYQREELMSMMDCFKTFVFMEHYRVKEIYACEGYNYETKRLEYRRLFG